MKLVALMPVRNEAWVLGLSARVALMWCDELIILDHASTDHSFGMGLDLQDEVGGRVSLIAVNDPTWDEMRHRQMMLNEARLHGATHIAMIDADEVLTGNLLGAGAENMMTLLQEGAGIVQLPGYNLRDGINRYHANGIWGKRWFSTAFADDPRLSWSGDTFHSREPQGKKLFPYQAVSQGQGGVMHLWGASERRLKAKHALYKLNERLRWPEKPVATIERMYNWAIHGEPGHAQFLTPETWAYAGVPASWWAPYAHLMKYLDVDAEPWQEQECIRLVKEHGPRMFQGLDLFGVV